jgi:hypothetical protein
MDGELVLFTPRVGRVIDEFEGVLVGGKGDCCLKGLEKNSSVEDGVSGTEPPEMAELVLEEEIPLTRPCRLGGGGGGGFEADGGGLTGIACKSPKSCPKSKMDSSGVITIGLGLALLAYRETGSNGGFEFDEFASSDIIRLCTILATSTPASAEGSTSDSERDGGGGRGLLRLIGTCGEFMDREGGSTGLDTEPEADDDSFREDIHDEPWPSCEVS